MKYLLTLLFCASAFGADIGELHRQDAGLVGRWFVPGLFNSAMAKKASGSSTNDAVNILSPTVVNQNGYIAQSFNGSSQYSKLPAGYLSGIFNGKAGLTACGWVKIKAITASKQSVCTVPIRSTSGDFWTGFNIEIQDNNPTIIAGARSVYTDGYQATSAVTVSTNVYTHLAAVVNYTAKTLTIYVDGKFATVKACTFANTSYTSSGTFDAGHPDVFAYGLPEIPRWANLNLSSWAYYSQALSAVEVATFYKEQLR